MYPVAIHEAGHAAVALATDIAEQVVKVAESGTIGIDAVIVRWVVAVLSLIQAEPFRDHAACGGLNQLHFRAKHDEVFPDAERVA